MHHVLRADQLALRAAVEAADPVAEMEARRKALQEALAAVSAADWSWPAAPERTPEEQARADAGKAWLDRQRRFSL